NYTPEFQTVTLLDYRNRPLATLSQTGEERINVRLEEISPYLVHAVISLENERFYEDPGWDFPAIVRAFFQNLTAGEIESGASTITQQITRQLVIQDNSPTASRKIEEIVVAGAITQQYDKNRILELYLNEFFFGNQSYGVEAASQFYFGIPAKDLNLPQSAMLAGLLQAPAEYDPVTNPLGAFARMNFTLDRMATVGCLNFAHTYTVGTATRTGEFCVRQADTVSPQTVFQKAQVETGDYLPRQSNTKYPHFVTLVQQQLENAFGAQALYSTGFTVKTTLAPELQDFAQQQLDAALTVLAPNNVTQGAIVVTDPTTGAVFVYIGSEDFFNEANSGQVDYARAYNQPGSAIKPILYSAALDGVDRNSNGSEIDPGEYFTPATVLWDVPTTYATTPPYSPTNLSNRFYGAVALRTALQGSYNVAAVKTYELIGQDKFVQTGTDMGIRWQDGATFGLPSAVGATEVRLYDMMVAYGVIANGGDRVPLHVVESITDRNGAEIQLPDSLRPPVQASVLEPAVAYLMQNILSDDSARALNNAFPAGSALTLPNKPRINFVGAKTGTTDGNRDLWTVGFVSNLVTGVWLGRPDDGNIRDISGFTGAAPLWNVVMTQMVTSARVQPTEFVRPPDTSTVSVCPDTGTQPGAAGSCASPLRNEFFAANRQPPGADQAFVVTAQINTWTRQRVDPQFCNFPEDTINEQFVNISDSSAINWLANTNEGRATAQRLRLPANIEAAPAAFCDINTQIPSVSIAFPAPNQTLVGNVQILGQVAAPANFNRYVLEYIPAGASTAQTIVAATSQQPNAGGELGRWDTSRLPNGQYTLRLTVIANDGGYVVRTVPVMLDNPLPTATPTIEPTFPPAILTPIPFDNATPALPGVNG
ncbi:MAG: transglycosylase domain-containing protein, partial [Armatimonadetes bacterium]|nr:transglycosylase domain-containing protein [Anaerolineae bacterium]